MSYPRPWTNKDTIRLLELLGQKKTHEHITPEQYRQAIKQVWARIQRGDVLKEKPAETTTNNQTEPATCSIN